MSLWRRSRVTDIIYHFRWVENQVIDRSKQVQSQVIDRIDRSKQVVNMVRIILSVVSVKILVVLQFLAAVSLVFV